MVDVCQARPYPLESALFTWLRSAPGAESHRLIRLDRVRTAMCACLRSDNMKFASNDFLRRCLFPPEAVSIFGSANTLWCPTLRLRIAVGLGLIQVDNRTGHHSRFMSGTWRAVSGLLPKHLLIGSPDNP
ncbi:hypothetical protein RRG08_045832 [Elysia crispata]|uniref:Uncharacterized protein n=1 Tax=Elysia crispata TaxID=231223 RepID=A0AAE1B2P0_9GAST|nr:hypothetical protein RRG08_045832 [Elysia crispata]